MSRIISFFEAISIIAVGTVLLLLSRRWNL